ncbi:MAG: Hpt domain-containing protein [Thermoanaerobaculia bacterium]
MELDAKTLSQIRGIGGDELLSKLVGLYLEHTPVRLEEIRRSLLAGDWRRTERAIHSLRSSSVTLGATDLAEHAAELEQLANRKERKALESALPDLESMTRSVLTSMRQLAGG